MAEKLTYEQLEQRVRELEQEIITSGKQEDCLHPGQYEFDALFNKAPLAMFVLDREHRVCKLNHAAVLMTRRLEESAIGLRGGEALRCVNAFDDPRGCGFSAACESCVVRNTVMDTFRSCRDHRSVEAPIPYKAENGTVDMWALVSTTLLKLPEGDRVFVCLEDITERKRTEEALRESEARLKALSDASFEALFISEKGICIDQNQTAEKMFGHTLKEAVGRNGAEWIIPEDREFVKRNMLSGYALPYEVTALRKDGTTFPCEIQARMINHRGRSVRVTALRDITDRKRAVEALRKSEEKYKSLTNNLNVGIYRNTVGSHGEFIEANPAIVRMFGFDSREDFLKVKVSDLYKNSHERNEFNGKIVKNGTVRNQELQLQKKDGTSFIGSVSAVAVKDEKGDIKHFDGIIEDITEQKKMEIQFQQAQKMEAIGILAGGIAHDFNNLLMAIQGRASILLMNKDSSHPDFGNLSGIEGHVESAAGLTRQLLDFARGGKYVLKPTDLNELIKKQNRMFGRTKKEIHINGRYEENLWSVEIDRGQIAQVLLNLYVNAWQAMPGGGNLYLETENVVLDEGYVKTFFIEPGPYVKISVADTGVGMDKATLERIFDPFFTTKEMGRGTGLGLASVYGIIKNHGGFINVYSEKGHGTTFDVYLPASEKGVIEETKPSGDLIMGSETVLLIDDETMIIEVAEALLERLGYKVLTAFSGKEAIEIYERNRERIDMVVLDMIMPDMNGGDTYDRLKEIKPKVKVLLSSGYSINGQATEILNRGCKGFIQKPFKMKELSQKLREILNNK